MIEHQYNKGFTKEPKYHSVGHEIFYKGIKRVICKGESENIGENESQAILLAEEITKHLNEWPETLDKIESWEAKSKG